MSRPDRPVDIVRRHIAALRPWPEGEPLIQALERYAETIAARAAAPPASKHEPHYGNHDGYACGFSGPHCWECHEPWPCRTERGLNREDRA